MTHEPIRNPFCQCSICQEKEKKDEPKKPPIPGVDFFDPDKEP